MKKRFLLLFCTAVLLCGSGCTATQVRDRAYLQAMELQTPQTPTVQLHDFHTEKTAVSGDGATLADAITNAAVPAGKDLFLGHLELIAYQDPAYGAQLDQLMSDYRLSPACKIVGLPDGTTLAETDTSELTQQLRQAETKGMLPETDLFTILREWDSASGTALLPLVTADGFSAAVVTKEKVVMALSEDAIARLQPVILLQGSNEEKLQVLRRELSASEVGLKGIDELEYILRKLSASSLRASFEIDLTLARGLNYYTGAILEVKALDVQIGSITGGGRYDNLTGVFGLTGVSGVGISFGADRIFDVLNQLDLYPKESMESTQVLFVNFGERECEVCLSHLARLRAAGIRAEIYPEAAKMKKQMGYADSTGVEYVALVGENEIAAEKITLKNMTTGEQSLFTIDEVIALFA